MRVRVYVVGVALITPNLSELFDTWLLANRFNDGGFVLFC